VFNKIDLLSEAERCALLASPRQKRVCLSATTGEGCPTLLEELDRAFLSQREVFTYEIGSDDGAALAWLHSHGEVISKEAAEMSTLIKVALQVPDAGRFERRFHVEPV